MGPHMAQAFRDCCRATYQARGGRGLGSLWAITLGDVVTSALAERSARITPLLSHERGSHTHIMAPSHALPLLTPCANQMGVLLHPLALC